MVQTRFVRAALLAVAGVASLGGLAFLAVAAGYLWWYYAEPSNPYRNEAQGGVAIGLMSAFPFWLVAALSWHAVRNTVPTWLSSWARRAAIGTGLAYAALLLYVLVRSWGG